MDDISFDGLLHSLACAHHREVMVLQTEKQELTDRLLLGTASQQPAGFSVTPSLATPANGVSGHKIAELLLRTSTCVGIQATRVPMPASMLEHASADVVDPSSIAKSVDFASAVEADTSDKISDGTAATEPNQDRAAHAPDHSTNSANHAKEHCLVPKLGSKEMKSRIFQRGSDLVSGSVALNNIISERSDRSSQTITPRDKLSAFLEGEVFEIAISCVIMLNTIAMAVEMQYRGLRVGHQISYKGLDTPITRTWTFAQDVFMWIEIVFVVFFTLELCVRIFAVGRPLFYKMINWLDIFVVVTGLLGLVPGMNHYVTNTSYARLLRLVKLARAFRLLHLSRVVDSLTLLLKSIVASVGALFWSLGLLLVCQCIAGMIICHLVRDYILQSDDALLNRQEVYIYYGTFTRATFTMFEVTLANWAPACRVLTNNVGEEYALFFLIYRCLVGFAILNVINAVFVQQTIKVANADQEVMILAKKKAVEDYTRKLRRLFEELDVSGDGYVSYEEFELMLQDPELKTWMGSLEIDPSDMNGLFKLIDDGDGQISIDEFILGATRLRGPAKSIDMAQLMASVNKINRRLERLVPDFVSAKSTLRPSVQTVRSPLLPKKVWNDGASSRGSVRS